jgi:hypothetical protein
MERQSRQDLEHENQLMRERTSDATVHSAQPAAARRASDYLGTTSSSRAAARDSAGANIFASGTGRANTAASATTAASTVGEGRRSPVPQQRRAPSASSPTEGATGGGAGALSGLPSVLEDSAGDISDILAAMGTNPQHVGLGLNPRSSSMSGAYTRSTSGRGSTLDRRNLASPPESSLQQGAVSSVERRLQGLFQEHRGSPVRRRWSQAQV